MERRRLEFMFVHENLAEAVVVILTAPRERRTNRDEQFHEDNNKLEVVGAVRRSDDDGREKRSCAA